MQKVTIERVLSIVNTNIKDVKLTQENIDDNLIEFLDSLSFIQMVVAIEEEFECEIPDSKLLLIEMDTVNKILNVLQSLYEEHEECN